MRLTRLKRDIVENLAPNSGSLRAVNITVSLKFATELSMGWVDPRVGLGWWLVENFCF